MQPGIPWQMQRDDLLFILIPHGEKGLQTRGWNLTCNGKDWNNSILIAHLQAGGNYGYYPAPGSSILSIDIDDAAAFHQAGGEDLLSNTFRYSAWPDRHKYRALVECSDMPDHFRGHKVSVKDTNFQTVVELFYPANEEKTGGQCVGPLSLHPNGNRYEVFDHDAKILHVSWNDILSVVSEINPDAFKEPSIPDITPSVDIPRGNGKTITEKYRLSVMAHLPDNAYMAGDELRGSHPVHGSTSPGGNVALNPTKGTFYCFRCACGGDACIWDAICRGIIRCDEPYDDAALKKHVAELDREMPEVRLFEKIAWKKNQQAGGMHGRGNTIKRNLST